MKIAAIDIGSNSVRLMMWADGKTLYKALNTTRLGEGLVSTGVMTADAISRTAIAIRDFISRAKSEGAERIFAFATAAVRSASNRRDFLDEVKKVAGIDVDVISGEDEARIGILGAIGYGDGGIIDVGGASTEITVQRDGVRLYSHSANVGTVRLYDACGRDEERLSRYIAGAIGEYGQVPCRNLTMYAIGGTATTMASVALALEKYDPAIVDGTVITLERAQEMAHSLLNMPVEEVKQVRGMEPRRADLIGGGCLLMCSIMKMLGITSVNVSEKDNLEGYVLSKLGGDYRA